VDHEHPERRLVSCRGIVPEEDERRLDIGSSFDPGIGGDWHGREANRRAQPGPCEIDREGAGRLQANSVWTMSEDSKQAAIEGPAEKEPEREV